jgi:hypothetical protein
MSWILDSFIAGKRSSLCRIDGSRLILCATSGPRLNAELHRDGS